MGMNEQIGGSQESKLLHAITKQLDRLNGVASKVATGGGGGGILPDPGTPPPVWTQEYWQETYDEYQRPADWLTLPAMLDGEQKVAMLHLVADHDSNVGRLRGDDIGAQ